MPALRAVVSAASRPSVDDPPPDLAASSGSDRLVVVARISPGDVARAVLVVLGILLGAYLLWRVQEVLLLLFLAILLATSIEPLVNRLRRGPFGRGTGVLAVYSAFLLLVGLPIYLLAPSLVTQAAAFTETLPARLEAFRPYALELQPRFAQEAALAAIERAQEGFARAPAPPEGEKLVEAGATAAHSVVNFITVFVLALYWLVERATIKRIVLQAARPRWAREVNTIWMEVEEKLGGWVRGQLILMLAIGLMAGVGYAVIGLPNPVLLGVAAAVFEMVPMVGPFLAFAPAVFVALVTDPPKALAVLAYAVIIQQVESHVLVPRVMGHTVGISPLTVLIGILVGASLYGLPGAFLAVPVAGAVQVILAHVFRTEDPSQAEAHGQPGTPEPAATAQIPRPTGDDA